MAACNDYLLRAYVPSRARSREFDAYVAAEFGACRRDWILTQVAAQQPAGTAPSRLLAALRTAWQRMGRVEGSDANPDPEARRIRVA